eukprot:m.96598 g.96598  ORF g.96598 m.96598 type:complete len:306 (-) comp13948_c1_seq1:81-998(-)
MSGWGGGREAGETQATNKYCDFSNHLTHVTHTHATGRHGAMERMVTLQTFLFPDETETGRLPGHGQDELLHNEGPDAYLTVPAVRVRARVLLLSLGDYCRQRALRRKEGSGALPGPALFFVDNDAPVQPVTDGWTRDLAARPWFLPSRTATGDLVPVDPRARMHFAHGDTKLHWAAILGDLDSVQLLLSQGASPDALNDHLATPLMEAAARGHAAVVALLMRSGALAHHEDLEGQTALHLAARYGWTRATASLLRHGANQEVRDHRGQLPQTVSMLGCLPLFFARVRLAPMAAAAVDDEDDENLT